MNWFYHDLKENINLFKRFIKWFLLAVLSALIIIFGLTEYMLLNMINLIISSMTLVGNFIFGLKAIKEDLFKKLHL